MPEVTSHIHSVFRGGIKNKDILTYPRCLISYALDIFDTTANQICIVRRLVYFTDARYSKSIFKILLLLGHAGL